MASASVASPLFLTTHTLYTKCMDFFKGISLKQITHNATSQIAIRTTTVASTFAAIFLITYFQGFDTLGALTKITSFVTLFYLLADFGLNTMFLKYYFKDTTRLLGNLITLRVILALCCAALAILISLTLPYNPTTGTGYSWLEKVGIALFSLTIITYSVSLSLGAELQKKLNYNLALTPSILSSFLLITLIFIGAKTDNLIVILLGYVVSQVLYIGLLTKKMSRKYKLNLRPQELKPFSEFLLKVSLPLASVLALSTLMSKSDMFVLSIYQPNFDVGVYSFAYRIFDFLLIIPTFLTASMYPVLLSKVNTHLYSEALKKYATILLVVSLIATPVVFFLAPFLIFLKGQYALSVAPLQILSLALPFFFLTALFQWEMIIKGQLKALIIMYAGGLILSLALNIYFIPTYTYFAASVTTVITEGTIFMAMIIYFLLQRTKIFQKKRRI